jgi:hypothetical protein
MIIKYVYGQEVSVTVTLYSMRPLLLPSRLQFSIQWILSCSNNVLISSPSVIILIPSDITHSSNNVGYYGSGNNVFIIHLLMYFMQFLFTNRNNIISILNVSLP